MAAMAPMVIVVFAMLFFRWYDAKFKLNARFHDVTPSEETLKMPTPPFCTGITPGMEHKFFYFDLGATYCACERQWDIKEYWRKTFSGLAFNLPHLVDALVATLCFGDVKLLIFVVFFNEMAEETIVATSKHWGFNRDPAYDLEPRYDTLMRDVIHCMIGIWLGSTVMRVCKMTGWCDVGKCGSRLWKPREVALIFSAKGTERATDPASPVRCWRMALSFLAFSQIFLLYNLDGGIKSFSFNNVILTLLVGCWLASMYWMNSKHMPHVPARRLLTQHVVVAVVCLGACASCIWPPMPTIYLIMLFEGATKLALTIFEVVLDLCPGARTALAFDFENDPINTEEAMKVATVEVGCGNDSGIKCNTVRLDDLLRRLAWADSGLAQKGLKTGAVFGEREKLLEGRQPEKSGNEEPEPPATIVGVAASEPDVTPSNASTAGISEGVLGSAVIDAFMESQSAQMERFLRDMRNEKILKDRPFATAAGCRRTVFNIIFAVFMMCLGLSQPLMYESTQSLTGQSVTVQYQRHWCGNPHAKAAKENACMDPHIWDR